MKELAVWSFDILNEKNGPNYVINVYKNNTLFHSHTHVLSDKEREIIFLFNDALNTFYLRLYGVRHG